MTIAIGMARFPRHGESMLEEWADVVLVPITKRETCVTVITERYCFG